MPVDTPSSQYVNDLKSSNSKQLLNAYVYDFLIKSSLPKTAQSFIKEAEVPTGPPTTKSIKRPQQKDLLPLAISLDAPQGFLYEWWQIFWDVFNARTHRGGSENAQHYYQLQLLRQHKEHTLHNSTFQAAHTQAQAQAHAQAQLQAQMINQSQMYGPSSMESIPQQQQQMLLQQQYQQQMLLLQYQHQQHRSNAQFSQGIPQQPLPQKSSNHPPGIAMQQQFSQLGANGSGPAPAPAHPPQMSPHVQQLQANQLQPNQQQDVQQYFQQQQQSQLYAGQKRGAPPVASNTPMNPPFVRVQQAQLQMNQFRQQAQFSGQNQQQQQPQQLPFKAPSLSNTSTKRTNTPNKKIKLDDQNKGSPLSQSPHTKDDNKFNGTNVPSPLINQTISDDPSSGPSALQDYQKQLMLLESENKKMLNGSKKDFETTNPTPPPLVTATNGTKKEKAPKKMPPPKKAKANSNSSPASTPLASTTTTTITTTTTTAAAAAGRKKKEPTTRRRNKKSNTNSEPPTPTTPLTPMGNTTNMAMLKKDSSTVSKLTGIEENPSKDKNTPSSQLTPPISENAINSNNDATNSDLTNAANTMNPIVTDEKFENDGFPTEDEIIGGSQMIGGNNDLYSDFALSDFSNDISGDANFNLETFLNTDAGEMSNFDSYWRDGVEATD